MKRSAWIVLATLALAGCESPIIAENRRASEEAYLQIKKNAEIEKAREKKAFDECAAKPEPDVGMRVSDLRKTQAFCYTLHYTHYVGKDVYEKYGADCPCFDGIFYTKNYHIYKMYENFPSGRYILKEE